MKSFSTSFPRLFNLSILDWNSMPSFLIDKPDVWTEMARYARKHGLPVGANSGKQVEEGALLL